MADKVFANGMMVVPRQPNTPEFILGKFAFKVDEFINTLNQHRNQGGWVNVTLVRAKSGKPYLEVDTWQPQAQPQPQGYVAPTPPPPQQFSQPAPSPYEQPAQQQYQPAVAPPPPTPVQQGFEPPDDQQVPF